MDLASFQRVDLRDPASIDAAAATITGKADALFNCAGLPQAFPPIELQTLYEQMLARLPRFRLDPEHPPRFHGGHVVGVDALTIVWDV